MMPHPHRFADYAAERSQQFIAEAARLHEADQVPAADAPEAVAAPASGFLRSLRLRLEALASRPVRRPAEGGVGR